MNDRLSNSFKLYSSRPFLKVNDVVYSYSEAALIADNLAYTLITEIGVESSDIAAIQMENNQEFIFFTLALWRIGAVVTPINPGLTVQEANSLISFLKPKAVIRKDEITLRDTPAKDVTADSSPVTDDSPYQVDDGTEYSTDENNTFIGITDDNTALIMFTSGSTGKPKGVVLTYNNLFASFDNSSTVLNYNSDDRWLASLPFYHIGGFQILMRTLLSGACLVLPDDTKAATLQQHLTTDDPTLLSLVTTQLIKLIDNNAAPNTSLRKVLLGGGFISEQLLNKALSEGWPIAKTYGSTETSSLFSYLDCKAENTSGSLSSAGKPLGSNAIEIRSESGEVLPARSMGNIWLKGSSCTKGYYINHELNSEKFINGWYNSGDYGWLDNDGYLFLSARRNDLIISGGENINPFEVEEALRQLDYITDCLVFGEEDELWGHVVSAAIITKTTPTAEQIKSALKENLSSFKIPKKIYFVKEIPRNELGKINKERLIKNISDYLL